MKYFKLLMFTLIMFVCTRLLTVLANNPLFDFEPFESGFLNAFLNYQLSGLVIAFFSLLFTCLFTNKFNLEYFNFKRMGIMRPNKLLGIKTEGQWKEDGWSFAIIMMVIIALTTILQERTVGFDFKLVNLLLVIPFAATNAFTEEAVFRLSYLSVGATETNSTSYGLIMGSLVFGVSHYWGFAPNGVFGVLISIYLGYFLSKSIIETKGMYWAFMVHFLLDVVILTFMLNLRV